MLGYFSSRAIILWHGFNLQNALDKTKEPSAELFEHYGDILFMLGEVDEAVTYWQRALEAGSESAELLQKKIKNKKYIEK